MREDDVNLRLGRVLSGLSAGARSIREAVKHASPPGPMRQALDTEEHEGHWLTRQQVYDAIGAASTIEAILREIEARMDPRCKGSVKGSYGPPDGEYCRCDLPRGHDGDHECQHIREHING